MMYDVCPPKSAETIRLLPPHLYLPVLGLLLSMLLLLRVWVSVVFLSVGVVLLAPMRFVPLDRRLGVLLGSCSLLGSLGLRCLQLVDARVLLVLASIMVINFVVIKQQRVHGAVQTLQRFIRRDVAGRETLGETLAETELTKGVMEAIYRYVFKRTDVGFWMVCALSFLASPFIMNDGICLLLVEPVLDAFVINNTSKSKAISNPMQPMKDDSSKDVEQNINIESDKDERLYYMLAICCR
jgi:hypothetical protein